MCGIVGYIGKKEALPILLKGLKRLEYRGYDSAGVAILQDDSFCHVKSVGKIDELTEKSKAQSFTGNMGIAHTRWATHGEVTEENAHPHFADSGKLTVVHNGIIENYRELREKLSDRVEFVSDTDTEVLAHLIADYYEGDLFKATQLALRDVRGTYGLLVAHANNPTYLVAARLGSPLVIGIGEDEHYIASDASPILPYTKRVIFLDDGEVARVNTHEVQINDSVNKDIHKGIARIDWDEQEAQKSGFPNFMLKEIHDQPEVFKDAIRGRYNLDEGSAHLGGLNMSESEMRSIRRVILLGCGTASYAAMVGKYAFERLAGIPAEVDLGSEFRYRDPIIDKNTLVFAVSQSGETADTLAAMREAKRRGAIIKGIVNVVGSTIARESDGGTYIHAGPELAVASTKAFTNMAAVLILYALQFGRLRGLSVATGQRLLSALNMIPGQMEEVLQTEEEIQRIAEKYKDSTDFLFLGRGVNYPVALEGSLKLKEISYVHSEAYPGGEMKHGPIALLSESFPVFGICTKNQLYEKMKSNIEEVRARKAPIILLATKGDEAVAALADDVMYVPDTMELLEPLINTIPLQLFAYYTAVALGRDVDRPRNLAKSVTVE